MYKHPKSEPIAITGGSCRFAGLATSMGALWELLSHPTDLSKQVPRNRFNADAFYHKDGEYHGTTNSIQAYWLEQDHRVFDASFFNITPKEAEAIDPQQRLLLEVVYEAMESAGYTLDDCSGKPISVFSGVMTADYDTLSQRDELSASQYYATGNARSIISNRISYFFNFRGPSMTIDTACSSSLVALHQAVLSLRARESTMACVTGVNLMITPEQFIVESSLHMLSPTGKCRMWDADADGYARGEGVSAIFVKPLSLALRDGDNILGLIRETGVNSDGRTQGITMPNPVAQSSLIKETYLRTGLDPREPADHCQFFEAHGTGTQAGDPREAEAIHDAFFGSRPRTAGTRKMLVGSCKTVIGHTEGAAGLAGVMKVLLAMKHGKIPPNLHLNTLNPSVKPFYDNIQVPDVLMEWPEPSKGQPRRASVNSFGFGGTNSHAIIEAYIPEIHDYTGNHFAGLPDPSKQQHKDDGLLHCALPLFISAASPKSLRTMASAWANYLTRHPDLNLQRVCWDSFYRRTALPFRLAIPAMSRFQALENLVALRDSSVDSAEIGVHAKPMNRKPRILGVFTGQGAQWASMSRSLLMTSTTYSTTIRQLDEMLRKIDDPPSWSLEELILADEDSSQIQEAAISQPLCTALQIGLVDLLKSFGITFHAVVGHSSGEIAAVYAAGRLTARDAILISYYRGLYAHLAGGQNGEPGTMLAAGLSKNEALMFCQNPVFGGRICVAAYNAPSTVTLSGDVDDITMAKERLTSQGRFARLLHVDTAYHSPHMIRPALAYMAALEKCAVAPIATNNVVNWVSSVYEPRQMSETNLGAGYWGDNMVFPVKFHDALKLAMIEHGPFDCAIEIGPHPALKGPVAQTVKSITTTPLPYAGVLERSGNDSEAFSRLLGFLWCHLGPSVMSIDGFKEEPAKPALQHSLLSMPSYPWDHSQVHYRESRISRQYHFRDSAPHELLGVRTRDDNGFELRWRNLLRPEKISWLEHHSFQGQALLPASAYCVMALDAARAFLDGRSASIVEIRDLHIVSGVGLDTGSAGTETLFSLAINSAHDKEENGTIEAAFNLASCPADGRTAMKKNMSGILHIILGEATADALPSREPCLSETLPARPEAFYRMMDETGLRYSGPFRALESIERRCNFSSATLKRRHPADSTTLWLSPATLDTCLQSAFLTYSSPGDRSLWTSFLPTRIDKVRFNLGACVQNGESGTNDTLQVDAHLTDSMPAEITSKPCLTVDISISNKTGETEIQVEGLTVTSFSKSRPEDDYELYLHTVMDIDITDEIVQFQEDTAQPFDPMLVEICEEVAAFYSKSSGRRAHSGRSYPLSMPAPLYGFPACFGVPKTEDDIESLVKSSPHKSSLVFIQNVGCVLPDLLPGILPLIIEEASQLLRYSHRVQRVIKQIVHQYPRMNILTLVDPGSGLEDHIMSGLGSAFLSCIVGRFGQEKARELLLDEQLSQRVHEVNIEIHQDLKKQLTPGILNDLVVITDSVLLVGGERAILNNIRASMSPGGFLVLLRLPQSPLKQQLNQITGILPQTTSLFRHLPWPDILDGCGYQKVARNSDQDDIPGFSISVRQNNILSLEPLKTPWTQLKLPPLTEKLLIIGGGTREIEPLSFCLENRLIPFCGTISVQKSIESLSVVDSSSFSSVIVLADLDRPIFSNLTEASLQQLKDLLRPNMSILWLTLNARSGNTEHAATLGFTRTVAAEIPNLNLQVLDLEQTEHADELITEAFVRLVYSNPAATENLWTREPEVFIENGRRMIPRVLPLQESNDRLNARRRVVSKAINTVSSCVEIVANPRTGGAQRYGVRQSDGVCMHNKKPGYTTLQVTYSSVDMIKLGTSKYAHVCIGRDMVTGRMTVALSPTNASYISVPISQSQVLVEDSSNGYQLARCTIYYLTAAVIYEQASGLDVVLIDADRDFLECVRDVGADKDWRVMSWMTTSKEACHDTSSIYLHPKSSDRHISSIIPSRKALIYDLSEHGELSDRIIKLLPDGCSFRPRSSILESHNRSSTVLPHANLGAESKLGTFIAMAMKRSQSQTPQTTNQSGVLSVNQVVSGSRTSSPPPFSIVDWKAARDTMEIVTPFVQEYLFSPSKTYVLVGLTRDLGQSLTRLFVEHGARHVVLASRNPQMSPNWIKELSIACGARVQIEKLDVTKLDSVHAFKARVSESMPPVGGVVNGAMVLDDRVFSQMTLESWHRVLLPKTVGSKNLDIVFSQPDLEFFIMTSSFAAIGGHPGQSNYATANMYMNGLAANRRRRGLAASVLNIGVIYGLGLLQREKEELYAGLEREGYPPVSERDIHHMFLEAIVAGRPGRPDPPVDITTGLSRFRWGSEKALHWHLDPRFSHLTVNDNSPSESNAQTGTHTNLLDELTSLGDLDAMTERLTAAFTERLQSLMQFSEGKLSRHSSLSELGIDSLIAVDIRKWLWKKLGKDIAVLKLLGSSSIYQLCSEFAEQLQADINAAEGSSTMNTPLTTTAPSEASVPVSPVPKPAVPVKLECSTK